MIDLLMLYFASQLRKSNQERFFNTTGKESSVLKSNRGFYESVMVFQISLKHFLHSVFTACFNGIWYYIHLTISYDYLAISCILFAIFYMYLAIFYT